MNNCYVHSKHMCLKAEKRKEIIERIIEFVVLKDPIKGDVSKIRYFLIRECDMNTLHCIQGVKTCLEAKRYQAIINRLIEFIIFKIPIKGDVSKIMEVELAKYRREKLDNIERKTK